MRLQALRQRDQVLWHLVRCGWCQDEAAALRTLKRRMNALGETELCPGSEILARFNAAHR